MRQEKHEIEMMVESGSAGKRLDKVIRAAYPAFGRADVKESIACGILRVNGEKVAPHTELTAGQRVHGVLRRFDEIRLQPSSKVPFKIVHEEEGLLVIDKPAGVPAVPDSAHPRDTLVHGLIARYPDLPFTFRGATYLGLVHRLERQASGLMLAATTPQVFQTLMEMTRTQQIQKRCMALVRGVINESEGTITKRLKDITKGFKTRTVPDRFGKAAVTRFTVKERLTKATLIEVELLTGRTRQVRAHLASIGHPLVGDPLYLRKTPWPLMLHASEMHFTLNGVAFNFTSDPPAEFQQTIAAHRTGEQLPTD